MFSKCFLPVGWSFRHCTSGVKEPSDGRKWVLTCFLLAYHRMMCAWQMPKVVSVECITSQMDQHKNLKHVLTETWELASFKPFKWLKSRCQTGLGRGLRWRIYPRGWGDGSVNEVPGPQAQGPDFDPQHPHKKAGSSGVSLSSQHGGDRQEDVWDSTVVGSVWTREVAQWLRGWAALIEDADLFARWQLTIICNSSPKGSNAPPASKDTARTYYKDTHAGKHKYTYICIYTYIYTYIHLITNTSEVNPCLPQHGTYLKMCLYPHHTPINTNNNKRNTKLLSYIE